MESFSVMQARAGAVVRGELRLERAARDLEISTLAMRRHVEVWRNEHPEDSGKAIVARVVNKSLTVDRAATILNVTTHWIRARVTEQRRQSKIGEVIHKLIRNEITVDQANKWLGVTNPSGAKQLVEEWRESHPEDSGEDLIVEALEGRITASEAAKSLNVRSNWVFNEIKKLRRARLDDKSDRTPNASKAIPAKKDGTSHSSRSRKP
jgi:hypothetical protein